MKLLIISSRFPYPLEKGDKLRLFYQIQSLSEHFEICLCSISDTVVDAKDKMRLEKYCKEVHIFRIHGKNNATKGLFNTHPFQVNYFYSRSVHKMMQKVCDSFAPDHVYHQLIRTTQYRLLGKHKSSVDLMDCFSQGYALRGFVETGIRKKFYDIEAKRLVKYENKILKDFDTHFIISLQDRKLLSERTQKVLHVLPNGIDVKYFRPELKPKIYDLVFVGNMGYTPNIYAVNYILDKIVPLLKTKRENYKLLIAGANPSKELAARSTSQIHISGWMEDIRNAYNQSKIFIAPIFDGIGQQNKILEALAMQVPTIVSPPVAQGLDIPNVEELLDIANSPEEFVDKILLLESDSQSKKVEKASQYVIKHRSWSGCNQILIDTIKKH